MMTRHHRRRLQVRVTSAFIMDAQVKPAHNAVLAEGQ
jgi:hypothetical protein